MPHGLGARPRLIVHEPHELFVGNLEDANIGPELVANIPD
jgi:hypothetical protein